MDSEHKLGQHYTKVEIEWYGLRSDIHITIDDRLPSELLKPEPKAAVAEVKKPAAVDRGSQSNPDFEMTEEEERELAELLGDDDEEEDYSRFDPEDLSKPSLMTKRSREDLRAA